jgi:competence protein ComEC
VNTIGERLAIIIRTPEKFTGARLPQRGEYIKAYAELDDLSVQHNPYEATSSVSLKRQSGANAVAVVDNPYDCYLLYSARLTFFERASQWFEDIHGMAGKQINASISDTSAQAIAAAVVLGDKEHLDRQLTDDFRNAGLSHILVVSGFNVAIVAALVYYLLRLIGIIRLRWRISISMIVVAFYGLIIGLEPSVLRALASVELVFLALLLERKPDAGNITAAVASIALLIEPSQLFDPSFQLTYGAVFSLVLIYPNLSYLVISEQWRKKNAWSQKIIRGSVDIFLTSLSVTIGLLPFMILHFHHVTITAVFSNIIGIPASTLLTIVSFLLLPMSVVSPWLAGIYGDVASALATWLSVLAKYSGSIGSLRVAIPRFTLFGIGLYYLGIALVIYRSRSVLQLLKRGTYVIIIFFSLIAVDVGLFAAPLTSEGTLSVLFFDVGQGDAALIRTPNGKSYLIDLGGIRKDGVSVAERAILPMLEAEGISHINAGLITHMHLDHYAGAVSILGSGLIDRLFVSGYPGKGYYIRVFDSLVAANHISISDILQGERMQLDSEVTLYVMNPDSSALHPDYIENGNQANHTSLVMKIMYGKNSILFLGDIEASDEQRLVRQYGSFLKSDVVKVAHHGSRYSSSKALVDAARPEYAVVSVGEHNSFGQPTMEALSRWHNGRSKVLRTDREGAILFHSDGETMWREDWRN